VTAVAPAERKGAERLTTALLLAPAAFWFLMLLILPLAVVIVYSFGERAATGGYQAAFTFENYLNLPARLKAFRNTLTLAPMGTLICLVIGYPLAYYLAVKTTARSRLFLIILVIVPFWTSFLIRTYAWMFILGGRGIPALLDWIGIEDIRLINTPLAVLIGIVYGYLPLMVFPIFVSLEKLDKRLLEAAADLGATPWQSFWKVTVPLSMRGIVAGVTMVFVPSLGDYVTPDLLGGARTMFIGNLIQNQFLVVRDWAFGSAVSTILIIIVSGAIWVYLKWGEDGKPVSAA